MDKLKIQYIAINKLNPAKYNPRKIDPKNLAMLKKSIECHGLVDPIICNKDQTIIGGHQRHRISIELGYETIPVVYVDLHKKDEKALNIALNNPSIQGDWNIGMLKDLIQELDTGEWDMELTGFDESEIERLMNQTPPPPDEGEPLDKNYFALKFEFPVKDREKIENYIAENGKEALSKLVIQRIKGKI
jgi:ParB-like chromosome segregation protein Spo0J